MLDAEETGGDCDRNCGGDEEMTLDATEFPGNIHDLVFLFLHNSRQETHKNFVFST